MQIQCPGGGDARFRGLVRHWPTKRPRCSAGFGAKLFDLGAQSLVFGGQVLGRLVREVGAAEALEDCLPPQPGGVEQAVGEI